MSLHSFGISFAKGITAFPSFLSSSPPSLCCGNAAKEKIKRERKKKRAKAENGGGGNNLNPGSNVNYDDDLLVLLRLDIVANMSSGSLPDGWDERVSRSTGELTKERRQDHMQFPHTTCMHGRKCASGRSARSEFRMSFS